MREPCPSQFTNPCSSRSASTISPAGPVPASSTARSAAAGIPGVRHVYETVPTNIVFLDVSDTNLSAPEITRRLKERGVGFSVFGESAIRAVTHIDVSREDVDQAAKALAEAVA